MQEFNGPKSASSRRTIPLPNGLTCVHAEQMGHVPGDKPDELVFTTRNDAPGGHRTIVQEAFKPTLRRAELDESTRKYDLRHTHPILLLVVGVNPRIVSERLGHASVAIPLDVHSHVLPGTQVEAAEWLDGVLYRKPQVSVGRAPK